MQEKDREYAITELNEHDRKVLNKYTRFSMNSIENNTGSSEIQYNESVKVNNNRQ